MDDDASSEDESYEDPFQTKSNIGEDSIIEETDDEEETDNEKETDDEEESYTNLRPLSPQHFSLQPRRSKKKISMDIFESDSDEDSEPTKMINSFPEDPKQNNDGSSDKNQDNDASNSSARMKNTRISHSFDFDSEGILNSTSVHPTEPVKQKWRPSNAFGQIEEIQESRVEVLSDHSSDVIEVSDSEHDEIPPKTHFKVPVQQTLHHLIKIEPSKSVVTRANYEAQSSRVINLEVDFIKLQNIVENLDLEALPDKGQLLKDRLRIAENKFVEEQLKFRNMKVSDEVDDKQTDPVPGAVANVAWEDLQAAANTVLPKTFGKQAMSTYNTQKAVTLDRLQQLHGALQTCPKEDDMEEDPKGLKIPLMPHQRRALAWLSYREKEKPSGGILADDMGLGKTLSMISLIVKSLAIENADKDSDEENHDRNEYIGKHTKFNGGTLIVCPASLINQWSGEIDLRLKRGLISYNMYHGPKRETRAKTLAEYDVVITTYSIVNNENDKNSALYRINWRRIILDEAHQIRNYKAQTSEACCLLSGKSRWALTGTPMHNKELDMYALLRFLRCTPFDDLQVWKRWVGDKGSGGQERLHTVISSLMLRRTKVELMEKGVLNCMPEKKWLLVKVELDKSELQVYHKVLIFSKTLFSQFLHQRAEKNQDYVTHNVAHQANNGPNEEYFKMRQKLLKLNKVKNVSQHEILVLLLRLRQICCHPSLITAMLDDALDDVGEGDEQCEELNLLEQLKKLNIEEEQEDEYKPSNGPQDNANEEKVNLKEATRGHLRASDPIFAKERASSKIKQMLKVLKDEVLNKNDKAIIVSQWSSYLNLIAIHLREYDVKFDQLDGTVPVHKRMEMVNNFNEPKNPMRVLLLSLTAGGVGLNLVGANHLFLLDLHWNPQLENQAQDRIYRMGQTKPVFVYKFMAMDTIEERIKSLQDQKLAMAEGVLTGTKQVVKSKLSLEDLKMIFGM